MDHVSCPVQNLTSWCLATLSLIIFSPSFEFKPETWKSLVLNGRKKIGFPKTMQTANHPFFKWNSFFPLFILAGKRFLWLTTARQIAVSAWFVRFVEFAVEKTRITNNLENAPLMYRWLVYIKLLPLLMILPWLFLTNLKKFSAWNISNRWHPRYGWLLRKRLSLSISFLQPSGKKEKSRVSHEKQSFLLSIEIRRIPHKAVY